jgi:ubiquinone/menaquinone biosynthesis C-methylase UbiE
LLVTMAEQGLEPIGLDLSPNMGRLARARLRRSGHAEVPLVRARAQAMPFRDGALGNLIATFPAEFIVEPETHRELVRLLAPHGRLIIVIGARFTEEHLASRLLALLYRVTGQEVPSAEQVEDFVSSTLGLRAQVAWEPVGATRLMVLVAEKAPDHSVR